jgi:cytochrome c-type biogenesis protein CcmF
LLLNNVFLTAAVTAVFVGTLYPLLLDALTGEKISVGPPYFSLTFIPIFLALILLIPFGPRLLWRGDKWSRVVRSLYPALGIAAVVAISILALIAPRTAIGALCLALVAWLFVTAMADLKRQGVQLRTLAVALAHAGLGVTLLGVTGTGLWRSETLALLGPGESVSLAGYELRLDGVTESYGPNYRAQRANITVLRKGESLTQLHTEKRFYPVEGQETTETAIRTTGFSDLYLALGDDRGQGRWTLRAYVNPLAPLIWIGALIMALGGLSGLAAHLLRNRRWAPA